MLIIRDETAADVETIGDVTERAFRDMPYSQQTEVFIVSALRQAGALSLSLVAEQDGVVIGHIALSPVKMADGSAGWYGLGPISVTPTRQRQGIGSALMHAALSWLKDTGAAGVVLVGEPAFYERFGFQAGTRLRLPGVPPQYFHVLPLAASEPAGEVTFHQAFTARS